MLGDRKLDAAAIILIVLCVIAYASLRPEYRLQPNMPKEFFEPAEIPPAKRAAQERIANAYWKSAVSQVQWKYGYAHRLPVDPPAEFSVAPALSQDPVLRSFYWQRLCKVWDMSTVWEIQYTWNIFSLTQSLRSAGEWMEKIMRRFTGY